jgi:hypothetical protein
VLLFGLSSSTLTDVPADVLRIHLGIPSNAFPFNGRALEDDVVDITLQLLAGSLLTGTGSLNSTLGDGVDGNDVPFLESFPYLAVPHDERDCP